MKMIEKSINEVRNVIQLLNKHILNILKKEDFDESRLETLTSVRNGYVEELGRLIKTQNTNEMYSKKNGYER